ncbi:natural killer cell receptor 2B4-like [Chlamydotis macqueenii]
MPGGGGPRCPPPLLCLLLLTAAGGQGSLECQEQAVSAGGALELVPERIPQRWTKVSWRMTASGGLWQRIVTTDSNEVEFSMGPFLGRAVLQNKTLSLRISPISAADSGVYVAEFQDTSGAVTRLCFHVSVWEPVRPLRLEARVLHREPGRCNLSLLCTVPAAANVSYSWSCSEGPVGDAEPQLQLQLLIREDIDSVICSCNASNPASWSTASTDAAATCAASGLFSFVPWGAVAVSLGLALAVSVAIVVTWRRRRKRGGDRSGGLSPGLAQDEQPGEFWLCGRHLPVSNTLVLLVLSVLALGLSLPALTPAHSVTPASLAAKGDAKQMLTVYAEVGKARTHGDPNGTGEAAAGGNTVYAVICTQAQVGPSCPQEPESCTIYATVEPTRKPSSLKRKRLDPALTSTAYAETTGGSRRSYPSPQTLPPVPPGHHLS